MVVGIVLLVLIISSFIIYLLSCRMRNDDCRRKKTKIRRTLLLIMSVELVFSMILVFYQGYTKIVSPNITAYNNEHHIEHGAENSPFVVVVNAAELSQTTMESTSDNRTYIVVNEETIFEDTSNNQIAANQLIGKKICTYYKGNYGVVCIFVGQYDNNYNWDGECSICAYKDGILYYSTADEYANGQLLSYRRASKASSSDNWVITEKQKLDNGLFTGDTRVYIKKDIPSRIHDIAIYNDEEAYIPKIEDIYTVDELYKIYAENITRHYNGMYDSEGNWEDSSGSAYCIYYENSAIRNVSKGVFVDNNFMFGYMYTFLENGLIERTYGRYQKVNDKGKIVEEQRIESRECFNKEQFRVLISNELFKDEVINVIDSEV